MGLCQILFELDLPTGLANHQAYKTREEIPEVQRDIIPRIWAAPQNSRRRYVSD